jgi:glycyl-tRNA synthetase
MPVSPVSLETIVSLCKRRGFIFQSSEIYGGLAAAYDYGPLGVEFKRNVKDAWWRTMVHEREDMEGLDASILMHPQTWRASGHVDSFTDPLVDCKSCKKRFRADHVKGYRAKYRATGTLDGDGAAAGAYEVELAHQIAADTIKPGFEFDGKPFTRVDKVEFLGAPLACPECGQPTLTEPRLFNLMFRTFIGPVQEAGSTVYLRPETAQGIFVNFENVRGTMRRKLPFGIAQIGKSFRNEVTTKAFIFRTLEFEQMEIEFFCRPGSDEEWYRHWVTERFNWYLRFGIRKDNLRLRPHQPDELAHYARACHDVEYLFPMGWSELEGIANRTDYDLARHAEFSGKDLKYFDEESKSHFLPYVIEPSAGADRATMAFLIDSYAEETVNERPRVVLRLHPALAPVKVAVLPLLKKRGEIVEKCRALTADLKKRWRAMYDDTAAIGKLYRRQDEIGTPFCVTVDVDSLEDGKATVRDRDSMAQDRVELDRIEQFLADRLPLNPPRVEGAVEL